MKPSRAAALVLLISCAAPAALWARQSPFDSGAAPSPLNKVDELVFARLKQLGIQPANLCTDAVFVRRVFLDVIGTLPTAADAREFIADRDPAKRRLLVDRLLERDEFSLYWSMKWADILRIKSEFPINLWPNAVQAYHRWVRASLRANLPYDQFARELLTASGSNFRVPQVNFYRALQSRDPQAIASTVALTLMGTRAETWPPGRLADMAVFFSQIGYKPTNEWKEEIVVFDPAKAPPAAGTARAAVLPDGTRALLPPGQDPREVFAAWLTSPSNPWFARNVVNRLWCWLLGRGIVHEPDDLRPDNPPANPELLALLERELVAARYDLKHVYRVILNSATYQLSPMARSTREEAGLQFAHALLRPLDAEVLIDALNQITGMGEQYSSAIPEPYTFIPPEQRSIALADGSITSAFLGTFGRSPRDTGLASERSGRPTASQSLYLLNSSDVLRKIQQGPKLQALVAGRGDVRQLVTDLYLTILSRQPSEEELRTAEAYARSGGGGTRRQAGQDLAWALINSAEFRFRH